MSSVPLQPAYLNWLIVVGSDKKEWLIDDDDAKTDVVARVREEVSKLDDVLVSLIDVDAVLAESEVRLVIVVMVLWDSKLLWLPDDEFAPENEFWDVSKVTCVVVEEAELVEDVKDELPNEVMVTRLVELKVVDVEESEEAVKLIVVWKEPELWLCELVVDLITTVEELEMEELWVSTEGVDDAAVDEVARLELVDGDDIVEDEEGFETATEVVELLVEVIVLDTVVLVMLMLIVVVVVVIVPPMPGLLVSDVPSDAVISLVLVGVTDGLLYVCGTTELDTNETVELELVVPPGVSATWG